MAKKTDKTDTLKTEYTPEEYIQNAYRFLELLDKFTNKTGFIAATNREIFKLCGYELKPDENFAPVFNRIYKNAKKLINGEKASPTDTAALPKLVIQMEKLNYIIDRAQERISYSTAHLSPNHQILLDLQKSQKSNVDDVPNNQIEPLKKQISTNRIIYIISTALILSMLLFISKCSVSNSPTLLTPYNILPDSLEVTETVERDKMDYDDYYYPISVNDECANLEKDLNAALAGLDDLLVIKRKPVSKLIKEMRNLQDLAGRVKEQNCNVYFPPDTYTHDKILRSLCFGFYALNQEPGLRKFYGDYQSKDFEKQPKTEQDLKALISYKKLADANLPIDTEISTIDIILKNISSDLESDLSIIENRDFRSFLSNRLDTLKTQYEAIKEQQEKERKQRIAEENRLKKERAKAEKDSIKNNLKIWVFDAPSTTKMRPKDIVSVLKEKGFQSVMDKGKTTRGTFKHGVGYFAPKMEDNKHKGFLNEIRKITATGKYLLWEKTYENYKGAGSPFITKVMNKHFDAGEVDVILVF